MRRGRIPRQLSRATLIMMLQSADVWELDDLTEFWGLDWSRIRTVHVQRAVDTPAMIVQIEGYPSCLILAQQTGTLFSRV